MLSIRALRQLLLATLILIPCFTYAEEAATYYIAPTGSDWNNGRTAAKPFRSFKQAFEKMRGGDTLMLADGLYSDAVGTGSIDYRSDNSGQPPSGRAGTPTRILAINPGNVRIDGNLFIGRSTRKDSYIEINGVTFEGNSNLYNTSYVTIRNCGFHGFFSIGTNDHHNGNDYDLIEDVWIWAKGERIIAINYRSHHNVWRRVLVRGDGCGKSECAGGGNPNVGFTVYDSHDVSVQNVMVVDRVLAEGDEPYADFAVAQHTADERYYFGRNEWLGTISLHSPDIGYYMEPDHNQILDPTIRISNAIAWDAAMVGFNLARAGKNNVVENITARSGSADAIRVAPELKDGTLRNAIVVGAGRFGVNSAYPPSYISVARSADSAYNQTKCKTGCYTSDAREDGSVPSLRYLLRIEPGSKLKGKGFGGADIGANVIYRYGTEGARFGENGYNSLTNAPLWPWPNEDRIKREMCELSKVRRGFCSSPSLTRYIWEYLGNPIPAEIYGNNKATAPAGKKKSS